MANQLVTISNLEKRFGQQIAVSDFSIEIQRGEIFAFLGSNGSGKTTTIRCLLGIYQADKGELLIDGAKYSPERNQLIGYLPEERGLYTKSKVMELFYYFGQLRSLSNNDIKKRSYDYLERVGLIEHKDKKVSQLSSGMQQKVQLGITLLHEPPLLILDEPYKGLDPLNRQLITDIFREYKARGSTIMYSTHVVDEAQKLADRLVMIKQGKRILYGDVLSVRKSQGDLTIQLEFAGQLPELPELFSARIEQKTAELTPCAGVKPQEIIKALVDHGVEITEFKVDLPSLNEIFINLAKVENTADAS